MSQSWFSTIFRWCTGGMAIGLALSAPSVSADDWPQWRGPNRNGVWHETGIIESFSNPQLKHVWRVEISNGYSGPTVAEGRVYVTDRVVQPVEVERVLCFEAATGTTIWTHEYKCEYKSIGYPDGPRASVTIVDGLAYALGTKGHLRCLDAVSGELQWKKDPDADYDIAEPIWGIASAPLVDRGLVIVQLGARPDACIVALDWRTGEERWRALDDRASYSAPVIIEQAGQRVLVCWTGDHVVGLNPTTGEVHWKYETPPQKMVMNICTPVVDGDRLFLSAFYDGSYMLRLREDTLAVEPIWQRRGRNEKRTDALHCVISTPLIQGDYVYGVDSYGQLRCLDVNTGDRIWEDLSAVPVTRWANIHMVRNGKRIWMFNDQGELIISEVSPNGFREISRTKLIDPTSGQLSRGKGVSWAHPAYANRHVFVRNDRELVCANLAAE